jgi:hypothetical protein
MIVIAKLDIDGALKKLGATRVGATEAITRALNKTAITARAESARSIRDAGYGIKVGSVKGSISIRRATEQELKAVVTATGNPIPLIAYGARQTSKGVSVNVKNGRKVIAHAFIATMASGHKGVFARTGKAHKKVTRGGKSYWSGLPIKELFGPSIPTAFANAAVQDAVKTAIEQRFPVVLRQELKFVGVIN